MRVAQINATCGRGSTGKICVSISELLNKAGYENRIFYCLGGTTNPIGIRYASSLNIKAGVFTARFFGNWGFEGNQATKKLLTELERFQPELIHLHNIHSHAVNLKMLFCWIKKHHDIKVIWTFHDCWAYTGYCTHYEFIGCKKWKTNCESCPQKKRYSFFLDLSEKLQKRKKELLDSVDLTIVTPSQWMSDQVKMTSLSNFPIYVIQNGIDLTVFRPVESEFRKEYGCVGKYILLGIAEHWDERKGIDVLVELARRFSTQYQIVLVGTDERIDRILPENIISIHRTQNQKHLAEIYSAADVLVNPTREDNFPTVNMEAIACGTPVVTFNTGGSPEIIDENTGRVVEQDDIQNLEKAIIEVCGNEKMRRACLEKAKTFDAEIKFQEYLNLYRKLAD